MKIIRRLFRKIKNIIRWLPILFKDEDYDKEYLMKIVLFKLENMEKFFREKGMCVGAEDRANVIKELITIGDRILNDEYEWKLLNKYDLLENRNDLAFAKNKEDNSIITKKEYFSLKTFHSDNREIDLTNFFIILRKNYMDLWD